MKWKYQKGDLRREAIHCVLLVNSDHLHRSIPTTCTGMFYEHWTTFDECFATKCDELLPQGLGFWTCVSSEWSTLKIKTNHWYYVDNKGIEIF